MTRLGPLLLFRGQGGRLGLHAETASRGSEPVGSPTRSKKIQLEEFETGPIFFEGSDACRTDPRIEADPSIEVLCGYHIVKACRTRTNGGAEGRSACGAGGSATASASGFLRSSDRLRIRGSRAAASRLHVGRRQLSGGHPTVSGRERARERARLYLQVCERETARRPSGPETPSESVYAATVALNAGDVEAALGHLGRALEKAPDSDHAHYIMAVALVDKGDLSLAMVHLHQAIALNPENRSVAYRIRISRCSKGSRHFTRSSEPRSETTPRRVKARR